MIENEGYAERRQCTYDRGSKRTVQPTTTLTNQFNSRFRYISFGFAGFDIGQSPFIFGLGHQFEAKNTILGYTKNSSW